MLSEEDLRIKVGIITRQTNYTDDEALKELQLYNFDQVFVIKKFFGIHNTALKPPCSLNQETYKQIRTQLDLGVREFNQRNLKKELGNLQNNI